MARLETFQPSYQSNAGEAPFMRKWIFRALIISLILHAGLLIWFRVTRLERFTPPTERLVPRVFNATTTEIDPKLLEEGDTATKPDPDKAPNVKPIALPAEKPSDEQMPEEARFTPNAPPVEAVKPVAIASERPRVDAGTLKELTNVPDAASKTVDQQLAAMDQNLIRDTSKNSTKALLRYTEGGGRAGAGSDADAAGMTAASGRIENLIKGGIHQGDAPISLPGGALFEFNSSELKQDAVANLRKLGLLIKKNPNVMFSIEGHTDSFGDDETNYRLSLARAEAVKSWLVQNMDVDPSHIQTKGFGKSKLAVQPQPFNEHSQASIEAEKARQQPNRRVEVAFRFPKKGE